MPAGEAFTVDQRRAIDKAIDYAHYISGLAFSVFVGAADGDPRGRAVRLLTSLPDPGGSVVVLVDPAARAVEIVTGAAAQGTLSDAACGLAALSMQTTFAAGDLSGGLVAGLQQLGEHARRPSSLHTTS